MQPVIKLLKSARAVSLSFDEFFILLSLVVLTLFFGFTAENFFSTSTLFSILAQLPTLTVITIGMTLVLISGGIDLSVGSVVALSSAIIGISFSVLELPFFFAAVLGISAGGCIGLINGILGSYFRLPIFIVTLGMLEISRGMTYMITTSQTVYVGPSIQWLSLPISGFGISISFVIALLLVVFAQLLLTRTVFGRYIIAIGTNETAAKISGIRTEPYLASVLVISGMLAGIGGLMSASYLGASDPNAAIGLELSAIAAAVIGGTSLMGGRGSVFGAFIGVLIISVLQNGLAQLGVSEPFKRLITGLVIILAVLIDRWRHRL